MLRLHKSLLGTTTWLSFNSIGVNMARFKTAEARCNTCNVRLVAGVYEQDQDPITTGIVSDMAQIHRIAHTEHEVVYNEIDINELLDDEYVASQPTTEVTYPEKDFSKALELMNNE